MHIERIKKMNELDFKFKFKFVSYFDDMMHETNRCFKGIARNSIEDPGMIANEPDVDIRIHFIYDGQCYKYKMYSPALPICPAISRSLNTYDEKRKDWFSFKSSINIFECGDINEILLEEADYKYLEDIGCFAKEEKV